MDINQLDSYERAVLKYFNCDALEELTIFTCVKHVAEEDKIEVAVELGINMLRINDNTIDNVRIFPVSMKKEYKEEKAKGSCGFFDTVYTAKSGQTYFIGFNYGH